MRTTRLNRTLRLHAGLLLSALVLTACGSDRDDSGDALGGPASPPPAAGPPAPAPTREPVPSAPSKALLTVEGTVSAGVEAGCSLLTSGGTTYLLVGDVPANAAGKRVSVQGRVDDTAISTCQQGTPLLISTLTVAP